MSTDLTRIGFRARANPALVFTSLYHHITDIDNLRDCFRRLKGEKALGVDGVSYPGLIMPTTRSRRFC